MKIKRNLLYLFLLLLSYSNNIHATVFNAISSDDWDKTSTWDQGSVPGLLDTVVIDGYTVTIDAGTGNVTIKHLILTNTSEDAQLYIDGSVTVTVNGNVEATLENVDHYDIDLILLNGAILNVSGNVDFIRTADNAYNERLLLSISDSSRLNVSGDFTFDYKNADTGENANEIFLDNTAILDVTGNTTLYLRGGSDFDFIIQGSAQAILRGNLDAQMSGGDELNITAKASSHFQVTGDVTVTNSGGTTHAMLNAEVSGGEFTFGGDLTMNSSVTDKIVYVDAAGSSSAFNVSGDISMSALSEGDVYIDLNSSSNLYIGGDFLRPTNYGAIYMESASTITHNGSSTQVIPDEDLTGSGTDAFNFTNVALDNSAGFTIVDSLHISNTLSLVNGIISTTSANIIIIDDQATISGGSATAYIDGPIIKSGRSNGSSFIFPIGDDGVYAPFEVSEISSSKSQYTAQFFGDPPPFGASKAADVISVSTSQYWTLDKLTDSENVDITLHWVDADDSGVRDLDSLIIVGLSGSNVWESYGNGGFTGNVGVGVSGSISSIDGDPPPFGVTKFTFGTAEPLELPIELNRFDVGVQGDKAVIFWQTLSEVNNSHFVIERSDDGSNFEVLKTVQSKENKNQLQSYTVFDTEPSEGLNYYRLMIVDENDRYKYSQTKVVDFDKTKQLKVYPNPVGEMLHLKGSNSMSEEGIFEVIGVNGQRLYTGKYVFENGRFQITTDEINVYGPGTYFIRVITSSGSQVLKFTKVK